MSAVRQLRCVVCQTPYAGNERFCPIDGGAIVATTSGDAEADGYVGKTIDGRYLVRRLIGKGGMGAVYEADHVGLDRRVAIKLMLGRVDADALARFRREARAASKVVHANVVQIFDVGTDDNNLDFIVMEFLDGEDLSQLISTAAFKAGGGFSTARAVKILVQLLRGLGAIHAASIVHRDIKPANVLLLADDVVKLTDFGIAKSTSAKATALTDTGQVIGTVKYMAPEQLAGHPPDPRTDLYAAGLVLYELLAGNAPFESEASAELAAMHLSQPAPSLAKARPDASPELVAALERVLAKEPDDRFADADELIAALEAAPVSDETPVPIEESSNATRPASARGRDKSSANATSSEKAAKATTSGTKVANPRDSTPAIEEGAEANGRDARTETSRAASSRKWIGGAALAVVVGVAIGFGIKAMRSSGATEPHTGSAAIVVASDAAVEAASDKGAAAIARGHAAEDERKFDLAIVNYRMAFDADPKPFLLSRIGALQEQLGHTEEAAEYYRAYLAAAPNAPDRISIEARLAVLAPTTSVAPDAGPSDVKNVATRARVAYVVKLKKDEYGCQCLPSHGDSLVPIRPASFTCHCAPPGNAGGTLCTRGLDLTASNFECLGGRELAGKPGQACSGVGMRTAKGEAGPTEEGVMFCASDENGLGYAGVDGDSCTGFVRHEVASKKSGALYCQGDKQWLPPPNLTSLPGGTSAVAPTLIKATAPEEQVLLGGTKLPPGKRACFCHPKDGALGGSMGLCPRLSGHYLCQCASDDGHWSSLCRSEFVGDDCSVPKDNIDAKPDSACSGRGLPDASVVPGHFSCESQCAVDKFTYVGREGQACRGYVTWNGVLLDGTLDCEGTSFH